jgi:hypothetical protein
MSTLLILLIILSLILISCLPVWSHSRSWGYGPSVGVGLIVLWLIFRLMGRH